SVEGVTAVSVGLKGSKVVSVGVSVEGVTEVSVGRLEGMKSMSVGLRGSRVVSVGASVEGVKVVSVGRLEGVKSMSVEVGRRVEGSGREEVEKVIWEESEVWGSIGMTGGEDSVAEGRVLHTQ